MNYQNVNATYAKQRSNELVMLEMHLDTHGAPGARAELKQMRPQTMGQRLRPNLKSTGAAPALKPIHLEIKERHLRPNPHV